MFLERLIERVCRRIIPRIEDVMSKPVITVEVGASVMDVVNLMYDERMGSVVVTKEDEPVGIFTRRDLMERVLMRQASLTETKVGDVMSSPIMTANPRDDVIKAIETMRRNRVTRVVVLDESKPVGILTETDIELKVPKSSLSYRLAFKRYVVDTLAYIVFWSWITVVVQIYIVGIPVEKFVASSALGFIITMFLGGLFGRFLDTLRARFEVD